MDLAAEAAREPDRARVREVFRRYELRDPLRRLEEALGDPDVAAPAPTTEVTLTARVREGAVTDVARLPQDAELAVAGQPARGPRRRAVRRGPGVALCGGPRRRGPDRRMRRQRGARGWSAAMRPVTAHDAKALGLVPPRLVHDTLLGAYLLEPARRGYPFEELSEERGLGEHARRIRLRAAR